SWLFHEGKRTSKLTTGWRCLVSTEFPNRFACQARSASARHRSAVLDDDYPGLFVLHVGQMLAMSPKIASLEASLFWSMDRLVLHAVIDNEASAATTNGQVARLLYKLNLSWSRMLSLVLVIIWPSPLRKVSFTTPHFEYLPYDEKQKPQELSQDGLATVSFFRAADTLVGGGCQSIQPIMLCTDIE
ncbi:hypothetical protein FG05_12763, partial [Fusarium graminearum]